MEGGSSSGRKVAFRRPSCYAARRSWSPPGRRRRCSASRRDEHALTYLLTDLHLLKLTCLLTLNCLYSSTYLLTYLLAGGARHRSRWLPTHAYPMLRGSRREALVAELPRHFIHRPTGVLTVAKCACVAGGELCRESNPCERSIAPLN